MLCEDSAHILFDCIRKVMSSPIEEYGNGQCVDWQAFELADVVAAGRPRVLRGLCRDWPLVQAARLSHSAFAQALAALDSGAAVDVLHLPPEANGVVGYNASGDGFNYQHFKVSLTEVLTRLAAFSRAPGAVPGVALQSALIAECMPAFVAHHPMPCLSATVSPRLWVGNRVTTPAHFDVSHNIAVAVCGQRRFTLFPTEQVANLYIGPLDFAPTGAAITLARPDQPDFDRHPRLREALDNALVAVLEPGDALYLPPLWWHQVESLDVLNGLINYWWMPPSMASGMDALLLARLALHSLPAPLRENWRALFEHYVFSDLAATHIPKQQRGVLGELDAQEAATLRERIKSAL